MKSWLNLIFSNFIGQWTYQFFATHFKKKALLVYLKALKTVRQSLLALVLINIILQMIVVGFVGMTIAGIWLFTPDNLQIKLYWLLGFFSLLFVISVIVLSIFFSQKTWVRISGVNESQP